MPKKTARAEINSFAKGFLTEASPVNFPEGALSAISNFDINKDGTADRRLGMDIEQNSAVVDAVTNDLESPNTKFSTYIWENVGGVDSKEFLVIRSGDTLTFVDNTKAPITTSEVVGSVSLSIDRDIDLSFTSVNGRLITPLPTGQVAVISYNGTSFQTEYDTLKIRDVFGVECVIDGVDYYDSRYIAAKPPTINDAHSYNLRNQSWGIQKISEHSSEALDAAQTFYDLRGLYLSNSDMIWTGVMMPEPGLEVFNARIQSYSQNGNIPAAKGYFIIDALRRGTSRLEAWGLNQSRNSFTFMPVTTLPEDVTPGGATCCTEHAGRVFFAGFSGETIGGDKHSPSLASYVLFSQLVNKTSDVFKCYQEGDPTGRSESDIVDTDGGFIRISGARKITALQPLNESLIVFADNGVWAIKGGSDYGFTATNYNVVKICSYGVKTDTEIVNEGQSIFYWAVDGIYAITKDKFGDLKAENITDATIKSFYDKIEVSPSSYVRGIYDKVQRKIKWLYSVHTDVSVNAEVKELVFDLVLKCFSLNEIKNLQSNTIRIIDFFETPPYIITNISQTVVVGMDTVVVGLDDVVVNSEVRGTGLKSIKYLSIYSDAGDVKMTFCSYYNNKFRDWFSVNEEGVDADAYLITGQVTAGDSAVHKQVPYLVTHFKRTEDGFEIVDDDIQPTNRSGCLIRSQWDWANSVNSKKWSSFFQAYRYVRVYIPVDVNDEFDTGFELVTTKNKIRGRGRAFCFNVKTEDSKDCRMVGWNLSLDGNANV